MPKGKGKGGSRGKGKGKGKKKKDNRTDEEKARAKELKAQAEREKLARRRKLTAAFLKLKKDKEYQLIKINENKLLDLWRNRLRQLKRDELLEDFLAYQTAFERNLRKKDELIDALQDLLDQNNEEYDNAFDMHIHNIDNILAYYKKRLDQVRGTCGDAKKLVIGILIDERNRMRDWQEKSLGYLRGVMTAVNMKYREMASDSKAELFVRQEEIRNKANEQTHAAKVIADKKKTELWKLFAEWLIDYDQTARPLKTEYQDLHGKDTIVASTIENQLKKVHSFQRGFYNLTKQDNTFCLALQKYLDELNAKKDELKAAYHLQQRRFNEFQRMGSDNIRSLALITRRLVDRLDEMLKKREVLLRRIELCRRSETYSEKMDPFLSHWKLDALETLDNTSSQGSMIYYATDNESEEYAFRPVKVEHTLICECNPCVCEIQAEEVIEQEAPIDKFIIEYSVMEKFWIRLNRVNLERRMISEKKKELYDDYVKLKRALRSFMGGMNPQNHDLTSFADELMESAMQKYDLHYESVKRERKRKERCRMAGGLRMF